MNHIHAHVYANFLTTSGTEQVPSLPAIGFVVSGGHTSLFHLKDFKNFKLIGQTRDDAAGEAFDKVARILELGYPGGPAIDRLASRVKKISSLRFTCAALPDTLDFSFSGIKTAVLYHKQKAEANGGRCATDEVAYAFQTSVVQSLVSKAIAACKKFHCPTLLIGGGVAANSALRVALKEECQCNNISVYFPPMALCLDNAAMIAGLAFHQLKK